MRAKSRPATSSLQKSHSGGALRCADLFRVGQLAPSRLAVLILFALLARHDACLANNFCSELFRPADHDLARVANEIQSGRSVRVGKNVYARILRGSSNSDFTSLSHDPGREIVMLMDSQGIASTFGLTGNISPLEKIGYTREYIRELTLKGVKFKLLLMKGSTDIQSATWDNLRFYLEKVYGSEHMTVQLFHRFLPTLKKYSFQQLQQQFRLGIDGHANSRSLTTNSDLWEFRSFLYNELRLTELYTGNGFTETPDGTPGLAEYFVINKPIRSDAIGSYEIIELKP